MTSQRWGLLIHAEALSPKGGNDKSLLWSPRSLPFPTTARSTLLSLLIVSPRPHPLESQMQMNEKSVPRSILGHGPMSR